MVRSYYSYPLNDLRLGNKIYLPPILAMRPQHETKISKIMHSFLRGQIKTSTKWHFWTSKTKDHLTNSKILLPSYGLKIGVHYPEIRGFC